MNTQRVRIVVGEGRSSQQGLLRFVLLGEGYDVVADAANPAELARVLAVHKPDVVVLDDGIGATAVGMVREMAPGAKIVLVWPGAVVPIGGAAQVLPSRVLQELGPAVSKVTGVAGVTAAMTGTALVDQTKRDPAALRRMLRDAREPSTATAATGAIIDDREPAPVLILPVTSSSDDDVVTVPEASDDDGAEGASDEVDHAGATVAPAAIVAGGAVVGLEAGAATAGARSALNRRLGNLALGGAAVAGAIVLALALGGAKVPIAQVSGQAFTYTPPAPPGPDDGPNGGPGGGQNGPGLPGNGDPTEGGQGQGPQGGGDVGDPSGRLNFYPIQPYLSSFLPEDSFPPGAGGPVPSIETAGRRGNHNQHHRQSGNSERRTQRAGHGNRSS
jgi:CheY-like chemotaxis protein